MKKLMAVAIACTACVTAAAAAHATTAIYTQSFETPELGSGDYSGLYYYNSAQTNQTVPYTDLTTSDLVFSGASGIAANGSAFTFTTAPEGSQVAFIQSYSGVGGSLTIFFATTPDTTYQVTFELALRPNYSDNPLEVASFDGSSIKPKVTSTDWTQYALDFTTGAGETMDGVEFYGASENGFTVLPGDLDVGLDNITISAIPEPTTWAMMLAGFALVGLGLRRRNKAVLRAA